MKDFDILGSENLFLFSTLLKITRQGIGSSVCFALAIIDLEVLTRKFLSPADLFEAQTFCVYELAEVVVIGEYKHPMLRPF